MSFVLNGLILPKYSSFNQEVVEISSRNYTITGKTKKDIVRIKYKFILGFENISAEQFNNIVSVIRQGESVSLLVDEAYLQIGTTVSVEISGGKRKWGGNFVDIQLILEEI